MVNHILGVFLMAGGGCTIPSSSPCGKDMQGFWMSAHKAVTKDSYKHAATSLRLYSVLEVNSARQKMGR